MHRPLILASTSPFRRALLEKLQLPFETCSPDVDEQRLAEESPAALVTRLAEAKARAGNRHRANALIIGSDQVACVDDQVLGKPGSRDKAISQLQQAAGKVVTFYTGLCLFDARDNHAQVACEPYRVHFRALNTDQIARYVDREKPFNCAGSFKSEGYGITLFERFDGADPNTLIGLPLIRLITMLENRGVVLP